jgi:hypothetical protein
VTERGDRRWIQGAPFLSNGDQVCGALNGERGIVVDIEGAHIRVRIDSNGQVWSSAARLWLKQ